MEIIKFGYLSGEKLLSKFGVSMRNWPACFEKASFLYAGSYTPPPGLGGTPILGHIRVVRPEWVSFPGQKPADSANF